MPTNSRRFIRLPLASLALAPSTLRLCVLVGRTPGGMCALALADAAGMHACTVQRLLRAGLAAGVLTRSRRGTRAPWRYTLAHTERFVALPEGWASASASVLRVLSAVLAAGHWATWAREGWVRVQAERAAALVGCSERTVWRALGAAVAAGILQRAGEGVYSRPGLTELHTRDCQNRTSGTDKTAHPGLHSSTSTRTNLERENSRGAAARADTESLRTDTLPTDTESLAVAPSLGEQTELPEHAAHALAQLGVASSLLARVTHAEGSERERVGALLLSAYTKPHVRRPIAYALALLQDPDRHPDADELAAWSALAAPPRMPRAREVYLCECGREYVARERELECPHCGSVERLSLGREGARVALSQDELAAWIADRERERERVAYRCPHRVGCCMFTHALVGPGEDVPSCPLCGSGMVPREEQGAAAAVA